LLGRFGAFVGPRADDDWGRLLDAGVECVVIIERAVVVERAAHASVLAFVVVFFLFRCLVWHLLYFVKLRVQVPQLFSGYRLVESLHLLHEVSHL